MFYNDFLDLLEKVNNNDRDSLSTFYLDYNKLYTDNFNDNEVKIKMNDKLEALVNFSLEEQREHEKF